MWVLDKVERRFNSNNQEESNVRNSQGEQSEEVNDNPIGNPKGKDSTKDKYSKGYIVIQYTQGLGESIKTMCKKIWHPDPLHRTINPRTKIL